MEPLRSMIARGASLGVGERSMVRRALAAPWLFPLGELRAQASALRAPDGDSDSKPGEAILVSVAKDFTRRSLWRLRRGAAVPRSSPPFLESARTALQLAERTVTRDLPYLPGLEAMHRPGVWFAEYLWSEGSGIDQELDGPSYGASMLIAVASLVMGVPAATDLAASAELLPNGALGEVGELEHKLAVLAGSALGVKRVVVANSQKLAAEARAKSVAPGLAIVGASTVRDLFTAAFPDVDKQLQATWSDPGSARILARRLFFLTLEGVQNGHPILNWRGVHNAAGLLLEALPPQELVALQEARFARLVSARHCGEPNARIPWPDAEALQGMPRPVRLRYLAHAVQSAYDANAPDLSSIVDDVLRKASSVIDCHDVELQLLGATSRALSGLRRYDEAASLLARVVEGWMGLNLAADSSYALCELIRVMGIRGDREGLDSAMLAGYLTAFEEDLKSTDLSRAFVRFALGRAWATIGDASRARAELDRPIFEEGVIRAHLHQSRLRWQAIVADLQGRIGEADSLRARIAEDADGSFSFPRWMAELDRCRRDGHDPFPAIEELCARHAQATAFLIQEGMPVEEQAAILAREFPY